EPREWAPNGVRSVDVCHLEGRGRHHGMVRIPLEFVPWAETACRWLQFPGRSICCVAPQAPRRRAAASGNDGTSDNRSGIVALMTAQSDINVAVQHSVSFRITFLPTHT